MKKGKIEHIRSQLSRQSDRARMAYGKLTEERPRAFVMIGSTNASQNAPYLADIDGNRRFWPVEVGRCDVAGLIAVRDQIWAEAAAHEERGESIRLPGLGWKRMQRRLKRGAIREACYVKGTSGRLLVVERDDLGRSGHMLKYADGYHVPSTGDYDDL